MADLAKSKPAQRPVAAEGHSGADSPAICGEARCGAAGRSGSGGLRLGLARAEVAGLRGRGRHAAMPNANGAGIAADPTLTSAWTPLARDASGEPSASFAPGYAWRPMSSLLLPCLAAGLARDLSPALAPASGFRCCPAAPFRSPKSPMFAALHSRLAETLYLSRSGLAAGCGLASSPITRSGQVYGLSGSFSVAPASSSRLAFGQGLLHALSRQARGQLPPPSSGSKLR